MPLGAALKNCLDLLSGPPSLTLPDFQHQTAKAFVTLRSGHAPFTLEELQAFLKDRLGRHEMPRALEFRESLPRSAAGKLLAKALIEEEKQKSAAAAPPVAQDLKAS